MKCPECGEENTLSIQCLYQISRIYPITKKGCMSKKYRIEDIGTEEVEILCCDNGCNVNENYTWVIDPITKELQIITEKRWSWK